MKRDKILEILQNHMPEFKAQGVKNLAIFGSVARDEARPESDVDILVEFYGPFGLFELIALRQRLEEILGCSVDLGTPDSLKVNIRQKILEDSINVTQTMA
jgi:predicted nucleotidyltransferase